MNFNFRPAGKNRVQLIKIKYFKFLFSQKGTTEKRKVGFLKPIS